MALLSATLVAGLQPRPANAASGFERIKGALALIGYAADAKSTTVAGFGTGFCVTTSANKSYFVTADHVVTDSLGNVRPNLFAILPKDAGTRYKASVVRHVAPPLDLAVVSIDAACDTTVKGSLGVPSAGDAIAIAGFPYSEVCEMAAMCGPDRAVANGHKGRLIPPLHTGEVSQAQQGDAAILYDAPTAPGNSGGPLFDPHTGDVYGIIDDSLTEYSEEGAPPQRGDNRAIAMAIGLTFINGDAGGPVKLALVGSTTRGPLGGSNRYDAASLGSDACRRAWRDFDEAYGEWAQAHGKIESFAEYAAAPDHEQRTPSLQGLAGKIHAREAAILGRMRGAVAAMQSAGAATMLKPAAALVDAVSASTAADAASAVSLGSAKPNAQALDARLHAAAQDMDSITACS